MALRELTFNELTRVAGGYYDTTYDSGGGGGAQGGDSGGSGGTGNQNNTPTTQLIYFDNQQIADNDGITVDNNQSYVNAATGIVNAVDTAYQDVDEHGPGSGYDSQGNIFADFGNVFGNGSLIDEIRALVPYDATIFGYHSPDDPSNALSSQQVQDLGLTANGVGTYTGTLGDIPVSVTYHGVSSDQQKSDSNDSVVVNGSYYTVSFLGLNSDQASSLGLDVSYTPPTNNPGDVSDRHAVYEKMNDAINSSSSHYHTHFFAAAANVTGITALGGAEEVSNFDPFNYPFSGSSVNALEQIGGDLYKYVNAPVFNALYTGNDNFVVHVERSDDSFVPMHLGDIASQGENAIDAALVMNEQYNVQLELQRIDPGTVNTLTNESNSIISAFPDQAMTMAQQRLGHSVNFASVNDRIQLGYNEIAVAAASGH